MVAVAIKIPAVAVRVGRVVVKAAVEAKAGVEGVIAASKKMGDGVTKF